MVIMKKQFDEACCFQGNILPVSLEGVGSLACLVPKVEEEKKRREGGA